MDGNDYIERGRYISTSDFQAKFEKGMHLGVGAFGIVSMAIAKGVCLHFFVI